MVKPHKYQSYICNADVAWRQVVEKKMAWGVVILIGKHHSVMIMMMFMKMIFCDDDVVRGYDEDNVDPYWKTVHSKMPKVI